MLQLDSAQPNYSNFLKLNESEREPAQTQSNPGEVIQKSVEQVSETHNMEAEQIECVVVGTGWTGLICAQTYLDFKPDADVVLIDDGPSIGGSWRKERIYPNLYAQVKYGQFEYSFERMRREGISGDGYISGETINRYLLDFADKYDLVRRSRLGITVASITRLPTEDGWRLELGGGKRPIECRKLIYATGPTSHAISPKWPTRNFDVPVIHSSETGVHLDELAESKVKEAVVVGGAKSAFDTVFLLLKQGKKVHWVIRKDGSGAVALMPPTIFGLVNTIDVMATRFFATFGASIMNTKGLGYRLVHRTALGRACHKAFWRTTNWIAEEHAGYKRTENAYKLRALPHGEGIFWANAGLGCASVPDFWKVFHAGDCTVHRSEPRCLEDNAVKLVDGTEIRPDYMILCTGFDKNYEPFDEKTSLDLGLTYDPKTVKKWAELAQEGENEVDKALPVLKKSNVAVRAKEQLHGPSRHYRRMVVPELAEKGDRSIIFPGLMHNVYTPLVGEVQALWGVAFLLGLHDVPKIDEMEKEVATWNVWTAKRYRTQGKKHSYGIYDFISYIDVLLEDLGVNTRRKSSWIMDTFEPYYPRHYKGIAQEYRDALKRRKAGRPSVAPPKGNGALIESFVLVAFLAAIFTIAFRA
jgi:dimethylaniline monooxygenase (N-oxide forming)